MEKVAMIIEKQSDVTAAVLEQLQQSSDPRFKEIMIAAVTHLHGFIRDARLSEAEFHQACALIARLGQLTTASHNERSEEHTSELQSPCNLVCRLLLEKKKTKRYRAFPSTPSKSPRFRRASAVVCLLNIR